MMKKTIILILAITFKSIFIEQVSAQKLPNLVIYLADDQTQADGSVYGAKVLKTPTAEKIPAAENDLRAAAIVQIYYIRPTEEFFDLENDPHGQINLIHSEKQQEQIKEMRGLLDNWMIEQGDHKDIYTMLHPINGPKPHEIFINK